MKGKNVLKDDLTNKWLKKKLEEDFNVDLNTVEYIMVDYIPSEIFGMMGGQGIRLYLKDGGFQAIKFSEFFNFIRASKIYTLEDLGLK